LRFERLADPRVELLSLALDEGVVQSVFQQSVLEDVSAARRPPIGIQDFCLREVGQLGLKSRLVEVGNGEKQLVAEFATEHRSQLSQLPFDLHAVHAGHDQILERGGNLVCR